jgi:hypothetical protein
LDFAGSGYHFISSFTQAQKTDVLSCGAFLTYIYRPFSAGISADGKKARCKANNDLP